MFYIIIGWFKVTSSNYRLPLSFVEFGNNEAQAIKKANSKGYSNCKVVASDKDNLQANMLDDIVYHSMNAISDHANVRMVI